MIPSKHRFHGHNSIRYVYSNGKSARSKVATIKYVANPHRKYSRVAVVVSKKVIKSAIGRNRIRRRIYEYVRTQALPHFSRPYDVAIIVSSPELTTLAYEEFKNSFDQLFGQTTLYKTT